MSNTLGAAPPLPPPSGPPAPPNPGIGAQLDATLAAVPELTNQPATAVAIAASGGDVALKGQAVVHAGNQAANVAAQKQVTQSSGGGFFGELGHLFTQGANDIMSVVNKPLSIAQREYRYLHDVEAKHGLVAALEEGAGLAAGAVGGGLLGSLVGNTFEGAALGAETAGYLEGQATYQDSWAAAGNPNYRDPHTGQLVSFGRDLTSAIGISGGAKTITSGALDGLADIVADPVALGGKIVGNMKTVEITAENVEKAWRNPLSGFRNAAQDIARSDAGTIARVYPQFKDAAAELGSLHSAEEVKQFFLDLAGAHEMMQAGKMPTVTEAINSDSLKVNAKNLPTLSAVRAPLFAGKVMAGSTDAERGTGLREIAANAGEGPLSQLPGIAGTVAQKVATNAVIGPRRWADRFAQLPGTSFDRATMDLSGSQVNPANQSGTLDVMNMVRYSGTEREARMVGTAYANATTAQRITIIKNVTMRNLFNMGRMKLPEEAKLEIDNPAMHNSMMELLDGETKRAIQTRLENHLAVADVEGVAPSRQYAMHWDGTSSTPVVDSEGSEMQGAITPNQTGHISIPNLVEARRMALAIRQAKTAKILAGTDDFLYDHITQGFFKPLVLMSGGYGLHISLAEAIPNTLRHGLKNTIEGLYHRAVADLGYAAYNETTTAGILQAAKAAGAKGDNLAKLQKAADDAEMNAFSGWLYRMAGNKALENSQDAQYLAHAYIMMDGGKSTPGLRAGEALQAETNPVERSANGMKQGMATSLREGKNFTAVPSESPRFVDAWHKELVENVNRWTIPGAAIYRKALGEGASEAVAMERGRQAVERALEREPQNIKDEYVRFTNKSKGAPANTTPIHDFSVELMEKLRGAVHARPTQFDESGRATAIGKVNDDLLASIANGHTPDLGTLSAIENVDRPLFVKSRELVPAGTGTIQRIANVGFRKVLNPMVDILSRNQEFAVEYVEARRALQPLVDKGLKSEEEVAQQAMAQATTHSMRFVHNLHDRTQWTATMRNWAPFFFAQEQAYRRMGRLLAEDPGAFRRYQLMISGVHNIAANMQDSNGNKYIAFPGSGFLGTGVADMMGMSALTAGNVAPAAYGGSFSSANVIFPFSQGVKPDLGPLVIIPAAQLSTMFSELNQNYVHHNPVLQVAANDLASVAGSQAMSQSVWEQIIPNAFAQRIIQTVGGNDRAFNSSVMQAYQFAAYQQAVAEQKWRAGGSKGPEPQIVPAANAPASVRQEFQNKIRNYTRMLYFVRALTGFVSPVSSSVEMQNLNIPARLQQYITKEGSVSLGMQAAHLDHPEWDPWMVSESYVPSNADASQSAGYSLASSQPAQQWITDNQALLTKYGVSALWLMPQLTDSKYSPTVYNEQIAQGLRIKDTPDQFLRALYVNAGNNLYYDGLKIHESALAAAGQNANAKNTEYNAWSTWVNQLEKQYPVWAEDHLSGVKQQNRTDAITNLGKMIDGGEAPPGYQTSQVAGLLQDYYQAAADYQAAGQVQSYSQQLHDQKQVNDGWIQYLDGLEASVPALKPIIQGVFKEALVNKT